MSDNSDPPRKYPFRPSRFKVRKRSGPGPYDPFKVSSVIEKTPQLSTIGSKITEYRVKKAWAGVVGPTINMRARPARLIGGTLHCTVSTAPWMTELNYQKSIIMEGLNRALGGHVVTALVFRQGKVEDEEKRPDKREKRRARPLTPEDRRFIEETISVIEDAELKSIVKRALTKART